jgi:hypothetical protein
VRVTLLLRAFEEGKFIRVWLNVDMSDIDLDKPYKN